MGLGYLTELFCVLAVRPGVYHAAPAYLPDPCVF